MLLAKIEPGTDVTVGADVQVAGRAAYNLVLTPKSDATLVGSIAVAVDGQTGLPLGVEVKARGQSDPAFRVAYTSLTLGAPDASVFAFSPPPGATVKEIPVRGARAREGRRERHAAGSQGQRPQAGRHRLRLGLGG